MILKKTLPVQWYQRKEANDYHCASHVRIYAVIITEADVEAVRVVMPGARCQTCPFVSWDSI